MPPNVIVPVQSASSVRMLRWEVTLIGKKGHGYGTVEAKDGREATAKAAEEFEIPTALRFRIAVTRLADKN